MTPPVRLDWSGHRNAPHTVRVVRAGPWPSGLYFLRVTAGDGRVGYAPLIVRPTRPVGPRRRRPLDEHVAGVQLRRRERRRLGRQLVRLRRDPQRRPRAALPRLRRAVPVQGLGPHLRGVAEPDGQARRRALRRRPGGVPERRRAREGVRPRRLPRPRGVHDRPRVRRAAALPRPGREPAVPVREQPLLEGAPRRAAARARARVARPRPARGLARRRPVRRLEPRRAPGAVHGDGRVGGAVGVRRHRPRRRLARSGRATGSRSTRERPPRRPGRRCWRGSPT